MHIAEKGSRLQAAQRVRRWVAGGLVLALGPAMLAGCSNDDGEGAGGTTTIRFLYATGDDTWNSVVEGLVENFNAQSETTEVQLDPLPSGSDYPTAIRTMDATGNWPAIVDMRDTLTYIEAGKLATIPESVIDLLDPEAVGSTEDGSVYTVPYSALNGEAGINVVYDKDYFEEHGLEEPGTYDEFIELMEAIQANGDEPLATAAGEVWPSDQLWKLLAAPYFAQYDGDGGFWTAAENGNATIEDLREPLEKVQYITDNFVLDGWQSTQDAQTTTLLVNSMAVMATSSAGIGRLMDINKVDEDFNAGLFVIPDNDGNTHILRNAVIGDTASGLAISAQAAEDEDEYASAVEFLEYFYSVEAADFMEASGWLSPNITNADQVTRNTEIPGADDYFAILDNPNLQWYENFSTLPTHGAFNTFFRQSRIEMQDGQATLDETIDKVQAELDQHVADNS